MGATEHSGSEQADEGSAGFRKKHVQSKNSGVCVEESPGGVGLNLGCGRVRWPGWVNVDIAGGDLQCDLRKLDLPDDHADVAASIHALRAFPCMGGARPVD
jgi:hypothetical protein